MGIYKPNVKRDDSNTGGSQPTPLLAAGKYPVRVTGAEVKSGQGKSGRAWHGLQVNLTFTTEENLQKQILLFEGSKGEQSLFEAAGYDLEDPNLTVELAELNGLELVAYLTVSKNGNFNNVDEFRTPPTKKGKPKPKAESENE